MKIYKYEIPIHGEFTLVMPKNAAPLTVQLQDGLPCLWALVGPGAPSCQHKFSIVGTGQPLPAQIGHYVGTFQMHGGQLVLHVFYEGGDAARTRITSVA